MNRSSSRHNSSKNTGGKKLLDFGHLQQYENQRFSPVFHFQAQDARQMRKLERGGGGQLWHSRCCLSAWISAFFSPAHDSEMRGSLVDIADCKLIIDSV